MKRVGYLYEKMCDVDFIKTAIRNAAKGKTDRLYVKAILSDIDGYARKIKAMLETETTKLSPSEHIEIYDNSCCKIRPNHSTEILPRSNRALAYYYGIKPRNNARYVPLLLREHT